MNNGLDLRIVDQAAVLNWHRFSPIKGVVAHRVDSTGCTVIQVFKFAEKDGMTGDRID